MKNWFIRLVFDFLGVTWYLPITFYHLDYIHLRSKLSWGNIIDNNLKLFTRPYNVSEKRQKRMKGWTVKSHLSLMRNSRTRFVRYFARSSHAGWTYFLNNVWATSPSDTRSYYHNNLFKRFLYFFLILELFACFCPNDFLSFTFRRVATGVFFRFSSPRACKLLSERILTFYKASPKKRTRRILIYERGRVNILFFPFITLNILSWRVKVHKTKRSNDGNWVVVSVVAGVWIFPLWVR